MNRTFEHADSSPQPVKCLIVDDKRENLIALEALLQQDDVTVLQAQSGAEALELLLVHNDIALALLDVQMPEMNGFELAQMIRGRVRTRHIPLIFITAGVRNPNWQFKGYDTGAVDFIYKPVQSFELASKAAVFFTLHRQRVALAEQLAERTEALRINDLFMAVLGHDLRTPLTSVLANASALERVCVDDRTKGMAGRIAASTRRMSSMIEDLLDITRIRQHGGLALKTAPVSLLTLSQHAVDEAQGQYPDRSVSIEQTGDVNGVWDGSRLGQVLSNLLGNAMRHGSHDHPITLTLDGTDAHTVQMRVANGGTIAPEALPALFQPFGGNAHHSERKDGLGLGLYIVQQIVQRHGGSIAMKSADSRTAFSVVIPRQTSSVTALQEGAANLPPLPQVAQAAQVQAVSQAKSEAG